MVYQVGIETFLHKMGEGDVVYLGGGYIPLYFHLARRPFSGLLPFFPGISTEKPRDGLLLIVFAFF